MKKEPQEFVFARKDLLHLCRLVDVSNRRGHEAEGTYRLWRFIEKRFPETKTGVWGLDVTPSSARLIAKAEEEEE